MRVCLPNKFKKYGVQQDVTLKLNSSNARFYLVREYAEFLSQQRKAKEFDLTIKAGSIIKFRELVVRLRHDIQSPNYWEGLEITLYKSKTEDPSVKLLDGTNKQVYLKLSKELLYQLDLEEINEI